MYVPCTWYYYVEDHVSRLTHAINQNAQSRLAFWCGSACPSDTSLSVCYEIKFWGLCKFSGEGSGGVQVVEWTTRKTSESQKRLYPVGIAVFTDCNVSVFPNTASTVRLSVLVISRFLDVTHVSVWTQQRFGVRRIAVVVRRTAPFHWKTHIPRWTRRLRSMSYLRNSGNGGIGHMETWKDSYENCV